MDLEEVVARTQISDVVARYARGVDRADWALVRSCYHPDAYDDHGLYKGDIDGLMVFLQQLAERLAATTHQLGNQVAEVVGNDATAETYCTGWYQRSDRAGVERLVAQGLRYLDHLERRQGRWAITSRVVVLDWEHLFDAGEQAPISPRWCRGARGSADASYDHFEASSHPAMPVPHQQR